MQPQEPSEQPFQPQPEQSIVPEQPDIDQWQQPQVSPSASHTYEGPVSVVQPPEPEALDVEQAASREPLEGEENAVRWQATEYIHREKDMQWYAIFAVVTVVLVVVAIFAIKSLSFAVLIPVMAAAIVVMSKRPPVLHSYTLSRKGLHVDDHLYSYGEFREFGLVADDDQNSIMLIPRRRFRPGVTIYFPEDAGEAIVDTLAARLPMKQIKLDPIDKIVRFLRI